jgi:hypothetical protein
MSAKRVWTEPTIPTSLNLRGSAGWHASPSIMMHLALALSTSPSVIMLRIEGLTAEGQVALIKAVWDACGEAIAEGAAVSTDGVAVRFRRLPLR